MIKSSLSKFINILLLFLLLMPGLRFAQENEELLLGTLHKRTDNTYSYQDVKVNNINEEVTAISITIEGSSKAANIDSSYSNIIPTTILNESDNDKAQVTYLFNNDYNTNDGSDKIGLNNEQLTSFLSAVSYDISGSPTIIVNLDTSQNIKNINTTNIVQRTDETNTKHYYMYVEDNNIAWDDAFNVAQSTTLFGMNGYLATITSEEENELISTLTSKSGWSAATRIRESYFSSNYLNGADPNRVISQEIVDNTHPNIYSYYYWTQGPEAGTRITVNDDADNSPILPFDGTYINFKDGEPNNSHDGLGKGVGEFCVSINHDKKWIDLSHTDVAFNLQDGFFIEFSTNFMSTNTHLIKASQQMATDDEIQLNDTVIKRDYSYYLDLSHMYYDDLAVNTLLIDDSLNYVEFKYAGPISVLNSGDYKVENYFVASNNLYVDINNETLENKGLLNNVNYGNHTLHSISSYEWETLETLYLNKKIENQDIQTLTSDNVLKGTNEKGINGYRPVFTFNNAKNHYSVIKIDFNGASLNGINELDMLVPINGDTYTAPQINNINDLELPKLNGYDLNKEFLYWQGSYGQYFENSQVNKKETSLIAVFDDKINPELNLVENAYLNRIYNAKPTEHSTNNNDVFNWLVINDSVNIDNRELRIDYYSSANEESKLEAAPMDVGTYYLKATLSGNDIFKSTTSDFYKFEILKADSKIYEIEDVTVNYGDSFTIDFLPNLENQVNSRSRMKSNQVEIYINDEFVNVFDDIKSNVLNEINFETTNKQFAINESTVTLKWTGDSNHNASTTSFKVNMKPLKIEHSFINHENREYGDGKEVYAVINNIINSDDVNPVVTNGGHINAGSYTAMISGLTGKDSQYYYVDNNHNSIDYEINKAHFDVNALKFPIAVSLTYGDQLGFAKLSSEDDYLGNFKWETPEYEPLPTDNKATVIFTPNEYFYKNYVTNINEIKSEVEIIVNKYEPLLNLNIIELTKENATLQIELVGLTSQVPTGKVRVLGQSIELVDGIGTIDVNIDTIVDRTISVRYYGDEYYLAIDEFHTLLEKEDLLLEARTLEFEEEYELTYGDDNFTLVANLSKGDGEIIFESSNKDILDVVGDTATIHGSGYVVLTAKSLKDENYLYSQDRMILYVGKKQIKVIAIDQELMINEVFNSNSYRVIGLEADDEIVSVDVNTTISDYSIAGSYPLKVNNLKFVDEEDYYNYKINYEDGTLIIHNFYNVNFESNGGTIIEPISKIRYKESLNSVIPTFENHKFIGWYTDQEFTNEWDFEVDVVLNDMTLYAKWSSTQANENEPPKDLDQLVVLPQIDLPTILLPEIESIPNVDNLKMPSIFDDGSSNIIRLPADHGVLKEILLQGSILDKEYYEYDGFLIKLDEIYFNNLDDGLYEIIIDATNGRYKTTYIVDNEIPLTSGTNYQESNSSLLSLALSAVMLITTVLEVYSSYKSKKLKVNTVISVLLTISALSITGYTTIGSTGEMVFYNECSNYVFVLGVIQLMVFNFANKNSKFG